MTPHDRHDFPLEYSQSYEDPLLRGLEEPRPWNVTDVALQFATPTSCVLDIGCGTAVKSLPVAEKVTMWIGLDPSASMRNAALENAHSRGLRNVQVTDGEAVSLPFADGSFDLVTCFVAPHITSEVARVLRPGGIAVIEKIGERDKANIKQLFGEDSEGPRGYLLGLKTGQRRKLYEAEFMSNFSKMEVREGEWRTFFSRQGLLRLCAQAKTVRNFDPVKDAQIIDEVERRYTVPQGIQTMQHRLLFVAFK